jgi:hypothetical protein
MSLVRDVTSTLEPRCGTLTERGIERVVEVLVHSRYAKVS